MIFFRKPVPTFRDHALDAGRRGFVYRTGRAGQATRSSLRQRPSRSLKARSAAAVAPPEEVVRSSDMRWMPRPASGAFFDDRVRELTPSHEISEDRRPYSIFGQRFITTFRPAASAAAAAASWRT